MLEVGSVCTLQSCPSNAEVPSARLRLHRGVDAQVISKRPGVQAGGKSSLSVAVKERDYSQTIDFANFIVY